MRQISKRVFTIRAWVIPMTALLMCSVSTFAADADGKLRIIAFGAHPDDCELKAGGVAAMWAARGHHDNGVLDVSFDLSVVK